MGGVLMISKGVKPNVNKVILLDEAIVKEYSFEDFEGFEPFAVSNLKSKEQELYQTPLIPDSVYRKLPKVLKVGSSLFDGRERDIWLISALSVLSGIFPTIYGSYRYEQLNPNLFSFIIAPQASGKGVMKFSKKLGLQIHNKKVIQYEKEKEDYKKELKALKGNKNAKDLIQEPSPKLLFIPGDTSGTQLMKLLDANNGEGIICESEADTLTTALEKDWGGFSDKLRNAFDNTELAYTRSTNNDYVVVKEPKLAIAVTGTPNQLPKLISSANNGLLTRNIFYVFNAKYSFDSIAPKSNGKINQCFFELGEEVERLHSLYYSHEYSFSLTDKQIRAVTNYFSDAQEFVCETIDENLNGFIIRMSVICFKIAMVLSALNEKYNDKYELVCSDSDINTALLLTRVFLQHSVAVYMQLFSGNKVKLSHHQNNVFRKLPDNKIFSRAEAVDICTCLKKSSRSTDTALDVLTKANYIEKIEQGKYRKVK